MQKKTKAAIMALVCMGMLLVQPSPTYAAVNGVCDVCVKEHLNGDIRYVPKGEMQHTRIWWEETQCLICGTKRTEQEERAESCSWKKYFTDLGHREDQNHRYRLTCEKCGGQYEITITTCRGKWTGKHETPW